MLHQPTDDEALQFSHSPTFYSRLRTLLFHSLTSLFFSPTLTFKYFFSFSHAVTDTVVDVFSGVVRVPVYFAPALFPLVSVQ